REIYNKKVEMLPIIKELLLDKKYNVSLNNERLDYIKINIDEYIEKDISKNINIIEKLTDISNNTKIYIKLKFKNFEFYPLSYYYPFDYELENELENHLNAIKDLKSYLDKEYMKNYSDKSNTSNIYNGSIYITFKTNIINNEKTEKLYNKALSISKQYYVEIFIIYNDKPILITPKTDKTFKEYMEGK
ncbi:MAG: hypothetical protein Q4E75_06625, partial [bacterium]|nr:hypothetical protein [bacterium]